ncbi:MAG: hypothetical protein DMG04_00710 [Acidobacteria bacterium]|nr:MAG: hypothetical protein DMG04_00710 [Acidobacteriota bacterium]
MSRGPHADRTTPHAEARIRTSPRFHRGRPTTTPRMPRRAGV